MKRKLVFFVFRYRPDVESSLQRTPGAAPFAYSRRKPPPPPKATTTEAMVPFDRSAYIEMLMSDR